MLNRPALPSQSAVAPPVPPLAVRRQPTLPPLPSAPIRQTSSDELVDGLEVSLPAAEPRSASHGKRSFLRPFLLKSKKKTPANLGPLPPTPPRPSANRSPPPAPAIGSPDEDWTHVSPQLHAAHPVRSDTVMTDRSDVSAIVDEYLQDLKPELESPYEETAFIEESEGSNPVTHPLRQATIPDAPSQQVTPMGSPLTATPDTVSRAPAATIQTRQADHGPPVSVAQLSTPPISAIPDTPASPSAPTIAKVDSAFNDPSELHGTQGTASPPRSRHPDAERDSRRRREDDQHERHRSRARERDGGGRGTGDEDRRERLRRREQEHRRSDDKRERRSRKEREEPPTWLEGVFDGLPFGPNISTVSPYQISRQEQLMNVQVKVVDSVQRDWRLFMAELIALVGLAYVVQASGW